MKTKITLKILVEQEGQPTRAFEAQTPGCLDLPAKPLVFDACCKLGERVLGAVHREYVPTPQEEAEDKPNGR